MLNAASNPLLPNGWLENKAAFSGNACLFPVGSSKPSIGEKPIAAASDFLLSIFSDDPLGIGIVVVLVSSSGDNSNEFEKGLRPNRFDDYAIRVLITIGFNI